MLIQFIDQESMVTIPSDLSLLSLDKDPYYRYKMPQIELEYQKKWTVIKNMHKIAKALMTPVQYLHHWLHLSINEKTTVQGKNYKIKGIQELIFLKKKLDKFIVQYLICPVCKYPELKFIPAPNHCHAQCDSCGNIKKFDEKKLMYKYIIKNPVAKTKQQKAEEQLDRIYGNHKLELITNQDNDKEEYDGEGSTTGKFFLIKN